VRKYHVLSTHPCFHVFLKLEPSILDLTVKKLREVGGTKCKMDLTCESGSKIDLKSMVF
jgi:hypothetical protein